MSFFDAFILGLVQGVAEFLPISSSGHLVLVERLLSIQGSDICFEVFLHFATLLAILIYFRKDIIKLTRQELKLVVLATIPIVVVGLLFKDLVTTLFSSVTVVSILLLVTGIFNLITAKKLKSNQKQVKKIGSKQAFIIGLFQALAILPGISRSGSTVMGGVVQGVDRVKTFRFSFLLVIPAVIGASLFQLLELSTASLVIDNKILLIGGFTAFISGILSLKLFEYVVKQVKLDFFGYYSIALGLLSLLLI